MKAWGEMSSELILFCYYDVTLWHHNGQNDINQNFCQFYPKMTILTPDNGFILQYIVYQFWCDWCDLILFCLYDVTLWHYMIKMTKISICALFIPKYQIQGNLWDYKSHRAHFLHTCGVWVGNLHNLFIFWNFPKDDIEALKTP